ncbi:MAG: FG-GAP-like repeat-containing protein [Pirellulaceae bacterium]|nr:FG-GAP-like repeat-containing protein [Pirellulaceae bacterium]
MPRPQLPLRARLAQQRRRRFLTLEQLEDRRVMAVAGADLSFALSRLQTELDQAFAAQLGGSLLAEEIPGFDTLKLSDYLDLSTFTSSSVSSAQSFLGSLASFSSTNLTTLLASLSGQTGGVLTGQLASGANGDNTVDVRFTINPTVANIDVDLPNSVELLGLEFSIGSSVSAQLNADLSIDVRLTITDNTPFSDGDASAANTSLTATPGNVDVDLALAFQSSPITIAGTIANGTLDYAGSLKFVYSPTYSLSFSGGATALANLSNVASSTLSADTIGVPLTVTLDAAGPFPELEYRTAFTIDLDDLDIEKQDDDLDKVFLEGVDVSDGGAGLIRLIVGEALDPIVAQMNEVIPRDVRQILLGTKEIFGGVTINDYLGLSAVPDVPADDLPENLTPLDIAGKALSPFTGDQSRVLFGYLEDALTIVEILDGISNPNLSQSKSEELLEKAENAGFQFPILNHPITSVFNILSGINEPLVTFELDLVRTIADEYHIPFNQEYDSDFATIKLLDPPDEPAFVQLSFSTAKIKDALVENVRDIGGDLAADAMQFLLDFYSQGIEFGADFRMQSSIKLGVDTYFVTSPSITANSLADSFYIDTSDPLFDVDLNFFVEGKFPASGGLALAGYTVNDLKEDISDVSEDTGITDAGEKLGEYVQDPGKIVDDVLGLGFNAQLRLEVGANLTIELNEPSGDNRLRVSELDDCGITGLVHIDAELAGKISGRATLAGASGSFEETFTIFSIESGSCASVNGLSNHDDDPAAKDKFAEIRDGILYVYGSIENDSVRVYMNEEGDTIFVGMTGATQEFDREDVWFDDIIVDLRADTPAEDIEYERIDTALRSKAGGDDSVVVEASLDADLRVIVNAGNGKDRLTARAGKSYFGGVVYFNGGGGNDYLEAGAGECLLDGEGGNDRLAAGPGKSILYGGIGFDILGGIPTGLGLAQSTEPGTMIGGPDGDILSVGPLSRGDFTLIGGLVDNDDADPGYNLLIGGFGDDHLIGGNAGFIDFFTFTAVLTSGEGAVLFGGGGDDRLDGTAGDDTLVGGWLYGSVNSGQDDFRTGAGDNTVVFSNLEVSGEFLLPTESVVATGAGLSETADGGPAADAFLIGDGSYIVNANGFGGNDTFALGTGGLSGEGSLTNRLGKVNIDGGGGSQNQILASNYSGSATTNVVVTSSRISGLAPADIDYTATGAFDSPDDTQEGIFLISSNTGGDTFHVNSLRAVDTLKIDTKGGNDTVHVGNGNLNTVQGQVTVISGANPALAAVGSDDQIIVEDGGNTLLVDYLVTPTSVTSSNSPDAPGSQPARTFGGLTYDATTEYLRLNASDAKNVIEVQPSRDTTYHIDGNLPAPGEVCPDDGDFLKLDTKTIPAADRLLEIFRRGEGKWTFPVTLLKDVSFESIEKFNHVDIVAVGAEVSSKGSSKPSFDVYDAENNRKLFTILAKDTYGTSNKYGIRLTTADIDGDGLPDVITAPGRNTKPDIKVFTGTRIASLTSSTRHLTTITAANTFGTKFVNGVNVVAGDVDGDCMPEVIIVPDRGAATIKVYRNQVLANPAVPLNLSPRNLNAFSDIKKYQGGATLAVGNLDGDREHALELIVATGSGTPARIRTYSLTGATPVRLASFNDPSGFKQGLFVAAGDVDGDGKAEIVSATGSGGGSRIRVYRANGTQLFNFQAFATADVPNTAVHITMRDADDDGRADIFAIQGQDGRSGYKLKKFKALTGAQVDAFFATNPDFSGGGANLG